MISDTSKPESPNAHDMDCPCVEGPTSPGLHRVVQESLETLNPASLGPKLTLRVMSSFSGVLSSSDLSPGASTEAGKVALALPRAVSVSVARRAREPAGSPPERRVESGPHPKWAALYLRG